MVYGTIAILATLSMLISGALAVTVRADWDRLAAQISVWSFVVAWAAAVLGRITTGTFG